MGATANIIRLTVCTKRFVQIVASAKNIKIRMKNKFCGLGGHDFNFLSGWGRHQWEALPPAPLSYGLVSVER